MTQLERLKHGLESLGIEYHEVKRYKKYGIAVKVVVWRGDDGRINEAEQATYSTVMHVTTSDVMTAEEAIETTIGKVLRDDDSSGDDRKGEHD